MPRMLPGQEVGCIGFSCADMAGMRGGDVRVLAPAHHRQTLALS
jgi:hypothetical protein